MGKRAKTVLRVIVIVLAALVVAAAVYLNTDIYHADATAEAALESDASVQVRQDEGSITFEGPDPDPENTYGLVLYQGAKVDAEAYAPLAHELAAQGWVCCIVKSPFDIAFFNGDGAGEPISLNPQVEHWYVGGHSLGGVVASQYVSAHSDLAENYQLIDGVVFLASYPTADLSGTDLNAISIYGTNDGVLDRDSYSEAAGKLPADAHEDVIDGGNHAQFGSYGAQSGDGEATISASQQVEETVAFIQQNR